MDEIQTVVPQGTLAPENLDFNDHLRNMWCQQQMMGGQLPQSNPGAIDKSDL